MSILDAFQLEGKVALVTGANRGIGQSIAVGLAQAGANVAGLSRGDSDETAQRVQANGRRFMHIRRDLHGMPAAELRAVVDEIVAEFGRLDILVNNAGIIRRLPVLEHLEDAWDAVVDVDLRALFFLAQAAAHVMVRQGGGKIINIASLMSHQGGVLIASYAAAKHGVAGVTRAMANELAPKNVNVNAIVPGFIATDINVELREDEARNAEIVGRVPAGDWGKPDDLVGAAVFLASDASNYVHGALVAVDGGWLAR